MYSLNKLENALKMLQVGCYHISDESYIFIFNIFHPNHHFLRYYRLFPFLE